MTVHVGTIIERHLHYSLHHKAPSGPRYTVTECPENIVLADSENY